MENVSKNRICRWFSISFCLRKMRQNEKEMGLTMATLTKKELTPNWNGYEIGDKVEVAFPGYYLQDSTRFPIPNECYWVKGIVVGIYEKACVVCLSTHADKVMVLDRKGIKHYGTNRERLA